MSAHLSSDPIKIEPQADRFRPYPHQQAAWDAMDRYFLGEAKKQAGMMVVPTGGGKTSIAARWLLKNQVDKGGRVLWLTHRRSLLEQAFETFGGFRHLASSKEWLKRLAISSQDRNWSNVEASHDVVFSMIQSAATERNLNFIDLMIHQSPKGLFVVVDEAHHAASRSYQRVLTMLKGRGCTILGLSATPVRMDPIDEQRMLKIFEKFIYEIKLKELIEQGILSTPFFETVETHIDFEREFGQSDFDNLAKFGDLAAQVLGKMGSHSGRNGLIVKRYLEHRAKYGKTIVFAVDTLHAKTLAIEFEKEGVASDYVDYTRKDCSAIMDKYRSEVHPEVLINVDMLTEGFDAPKTQTVFLARPSQSESLLTQMTGRALRGPRAGGTENAYLVTFVDTWKEFHPLNAEYMFIDSGQGDDGEQGPISRIPHELVPISAELIAAAYALVKGNVKGHFLGVHQCLPHSWYVWKEEYETDFQRRFILVFENQVEGFQKLVADYSDSASNSTRLHESLARDLLRRYFGDCPDPLPRWTEIRDLLDAYRRKLEIHHYTFTDKAEFEPAKLARDIFENDMGQRAQLVYLREICDSKPVCQVVYRQDFQTFFEDVNRHLLQMHDHGGREVSGPVLLPPMTSKPARDWPEGDPGYQLGSVWDAVTSQPKHMPNGVPEVRDLRYSDKPMKSSWGYFRFEDKRLCVNRTLNSPDVPRFVLEFLVYHEALHADMPNSSHDSNFRERERRFVPSEAAVAEALESGLTPGQANAAWFALAEQFLDTFSPGSRDERMVM